MKWRKRQSLSYCEALPVLPLIAFCSPSFSLLLIIIVLLKKSDMFFKANECILLVHIYNKWEMLNLLIEWVNISSPHVNSGLFKGVTKYTPLIIVVIKGLQTIEQMTEYIMQMENGWQKVMWRKNKKFTTKSYPTSHLQMIANLYKFQRKKATTKIRDNICSFLMLYDCLVFDVSKGLFQYLCQHYSST